MTIAKINELNALPAEMLSPFESGFITDNAQRVAQYGENTRFSPKQIALIDRIHNERVIEKRAPKVSAAAAPLSVPALAASAPASSFDDTDIPF